MKRNTKWMLAIVAIILQCSMPASAISENGKKIPFHVDVEFTADDKPVFGKILGLPVVLENHTRNLLSKLVIHPGKSDASINDRRYILNGKLSLTESGDDVQLMIVEPTFLPSNIWKGNKMAIPYPASMARAGRSGISAIHVEIGPDGHVAEAKPIESSHPDFEKNALQAIRFWKYDSSTLSGQTSGTVLIRYRQPNDEVPKYDCPADQFMPSIEGQSNCITEIDVTSSIINKSTTVISQ